MTPPTRRRAGFLRRWPSRRAEDQPGPVEDVRRADVVRVRREPARRARQPFPGHAVLRRDVPAVGARAGGVARGHRDHQATGTLSPVRRDGEELRPTRVEGDAVEPGVRGSTVQEEAAWPLGVGRGYGALGHTRRVQPLVRDHIVVADERAGGPGVDSPGGRQLLGGHLVAGEDDVPAVAFALDADRPDAAPPLRVDHADLPELRGPVPVRDARLRGVPPGVPALPQHAVVPGAVIPRRLAQRGRPAGRGSREDGVCADHRSRLRPARSPSARRTQAAASIEMPNRSACASTCRFGSRETRRFSDSRRSPLATTTMPPLRDALRTCAHSRGRSSAEKHLPHRQSRWSPC